MDRKAPAPNRNTFRVAIIGENGSGKTSLMLRLSYDTYREKLGQTLSHNTSMLNTYHDGRRVHLEFNDFTKNYKTILGPQFNFGYPRLLAEADVVIFVCDITNPKSLRGLEEDLRPQQIYRELIAMARAAGVKNLIDPVKNPTVEQLWEFVKAKKAEHEETKQALIEVEIKRWRLERHNEIVMERKAAQLAATKAQNSDESSIVPSVLQLFDTSALQTLVQPIFGATEDKPTGPTELPPFNYKKMPAIMQIVNEKHPPLPDIFSLLTLGYLRELRASVKQYKHNAIKILVATKCEILSQKPHLYGEAISKEQLNAFARANKFQHTCMVSAATGDNIDVLKKEILDRVITTFANEPLVVIAEPTTSASQAPAPLPAPAPMPAPIKTAPSKPATPATARNNPAATAPSKPAAAALALSKPAAPAPSKPAAPAPAPSKPATPATPRTVRANETSANLATAPAIPSPAPTANKTFGTTQATQFPSIAPSAAVPSTTAIMPIPAPAPAPQRRGLPGNLVQASLSLRPSASGATPGLYKPAPTATVGSSGPKPAAANPSAAYVP